MQRIPAKPNSYLSHIDVWDFNITWTPIHCIAYNHLLLAFDFLAVLSFNNIVSIVASVSY